MPRMTYKEYKAALRIIDDQRIALRALIAAGQAANYWEKNYELNLFEERLHRYWKERNRIQGGIGHDSIREIYG